jgi:hypothetical protein
MDICCSKGKAVWVKEEQCHACSDPFGYPAFGQPMCYVCKLPYTDPIIHPRVSIHRQVLCDECYLEYLKYGQRKKIRIDTVIKCQSMTLSSSARKVKDFLRHAGSCDTPLPI